MSSSSGTHHIPLRELQVEHQDALIFYAEESPDDRIKACELRDTINEFCFDSGIMGKAVLYDETMPYGASLITSLDNALKFSTLLFALYSKNLEEDQSNWQTTNASLWHTIENKNRSETFIPVFWQDGNVSPAYAREKLQLDMSKGNWRILLNGLISSHLEKRLDREKEQERLRSNQAPSSAPPNGYTLPYARMPSKNQDGLGDMDRQESPENIDVDGGDLHPHDAAVIDAVANGHGASRFPWNYMRYLVSEEGFYWFSALGFVIVSLTLIKLKAR